MEQFIEQYIWLLFPIILWSIVWKGIALWRAAKNDDKKSFIAILIINTLGIFEIIYLLTYGHRKHETLITVRTPSDTNPLPPR